MVKFPKTLKAAMTAERSQWAIGDALAKEAEEKFTGTYGLDACAAELFENGIDYSADYLGRLRGIAIAFPEGDRQVLPWSVHEEAGNPETLKAVVAAAKKTGDKVTKWFVREALKQMRAQAQEEARAAKAEADREIEEARKEHAKAKDDSERKAAKKKVEKAKAKRKAAKVPPKKEQPAPKVDDVPFMVARTRFNAAMGQIKRDLKAAGKQIAPFMDDFTAAFVNNAVEELLEIANAARELADEIRKHSSSKRGHLSVVG